MKPRRSNHKAEDQTATHINNTCPSLYTHKADWTQLNDPKTH